MKKVNLDEEYENFKQKFFDWNGGEEEWRNYQESEGLIDKNHSE